ncbi:hypothetical protein [Bosea minatitlanensis]|uniref:Uncharacterized protein n=1 Tax=Bosea minatitlanensis TaxID=128782 RepID=A0ABW0F017_9HYPH|nr:hypothetical protein [Bosea minatitlanensis]MCT4491780.1 hypothetical protein [Bosea minatitlanensis]
MTAPKISLAQQLEAVEFALRRQQSLCNGAKNIRELRPAAQAQYDADRLEAAVRTLRWLQSHEPEIRAFLKLPAEAREAVLKHGETMAQMCLELAKTEAIAKAGGPVR